MCYIHTLFSSFLQSCPAISSYSDENLDTALDLAAKNFCQQEIIVLPKNEEVYASKIFEWYESDFGKNDIEALRFVDLDLFVLWLIPGSNGCIEMTYSVSLCVCDQQI